MRPSFKDYLHNSIEPISESLVGKGFAIGQSRAHASNKSKLQSVLSRIQSNAKKGQSEDDENERFELLFTLFFDLAAAMKIAAELSTNTINVSTAGVLDTESIKKELERGFPKKFRR
jgi:hypothetical protein